MRSTDFTSAELNEANFENTVCNNSEFTNAFLANVRFFEVEMDDQVRFWGADLSGTSFKNMKLPMLDNIFAYDVGAIEETFGDLSVVLPGGVKAPEHWPLWDFDDKIFLQQWRRWQRDPDNYTPPPKPD